MAGLDPIRPFIAQIPISSYIMGLLWHTYGGFHLPPQPGMYYYIWLLGIGPNIDCFEFFFTSFNQILLISHFRKKNQNFHLGKFEQQNLSLNGGVSWGADLLLKP